MSQEAVAEKAGLHWTFVSGVERGVRNPGLNTIGRLAGALGWSLSQATEGVTAGQTRTAKKPKSQTKKN